jgi:hypothetical protein
LVATVKSLRSADSCGAPIEARSSKERLLLFSSMIPSILNLSIAAAAFLRGAAAS